MRRMLLTVVAGLVALSGVGSGAGAQTPAASQGPALPFRMTAWAINMSNMGAGGNTTVEFKVSRWSTTNERATLIKTFLEKGQDALLKALKKAPSHGRLRYPTAMAPAGMGPNPMAGRGAAAASASREAQQQASLGYDIRYAWRTPLEDGGDRIVLAFDRYITFAEQVQQPRTVDYPFTFIEIHVPSSGEEGEGRMAVATKLNFDKTKNSIEFEYFSTQPVILKQVKIEK